MDSEKGALDASGMSVEQEVIVLDRNEWSAVVNA